MRRTHLRGHPNILKRLLIHVAGFNLGLMMRKLFGLGKPRSLQDGLAAAVLSLLQSIPGLLESLGRRLSRMRRLLRPLSLKTALVRAA